MFDKILSFIKKSKKQKYYISKVAVAVSRQQSIEGITFNNYSYECIKMMRNKFICMALHIQKIKVQQARPLISQVFI